MENSCNLSNLHVVVWGFREAKGLAYTAAEQGFSFILDLFSGIPRKPWWIAWGVERIALHGMIDEARKTLKRARNVSMNLDTQSFSGLGCGTRRNTYTKFRLRFSLSLSKHKASCHDPRLGL